MVFLFAAQVSTSLPARYQKFGFLLVTASNITFETTSKGEPLYAIWFEFAATFASFVNMVSLDLAPFSR